MPKILTNGNPDPTQWRIDDQIIAPGQYLLIYADDDAEQGADHASFRLSGQGDTIALIGVDGVSVIDGIVFDAQAEDVSFGRHPDGQDAWGPHTQPTPGAANAAHRR